MDVGVLTKENFEEHLGTTFQLSAGEQEVGLELVEVTDQSHLAAPASRAEDGSQVSGRNPFSLAFSGPKEAEMPEGLYALAHPGMGDFALYLKPFEVTDEAVLYESVFN